MEKMKTLRLATSVVGLVKNALQFAFSAILFFIAGVATGCAVMCGGDTDTAFPLLVLSIIAFAVSFALVGMYIVNYFTKIGENYRYYVISNFIMSIGGLLMNVALIICYFKFFDTSNLNDGNILFVIYLFFALLLDIATTVLTSIYVNLGSKVD